MLRACFNLIGGLTIFGFYVYTLTKLVQKDKVSYLPTPRKGHQYSPTPNRMAKGSNCIYQL